MDYRSTPVPLCRCGRCKSRLRVLPIEIPPFKRYTLKAIETACAAYSDAGLPKITLRKTVDWLGPGHPHHSTLHGWLGGIGERALGRMDRIRGCLPVITLIAETSQRHDSKLPDLWIKHYPVAERKYRSPRRAKELESCARVFSIATCLFPKAVHRLSEWEQWLQGRLHVTAWSFFARANCTAFQQHAPIGYGIRCAPSSANHRKPRKGMSYEARSPP